MVVISNHTNATVMKVLRSAHTQTHLSLVSTDETHWEVACIHEIPVFVSRRENAMPVPTTAALPWVTTPTNTQISTNDKKETNCFLKQLTNSHFVVSFFQSMTLKKSSFARMAPWPTKLHEIGWHDSKIGLVATGWYCSGCSSQNCSTS